MTRRGLSTNAWVRRQSRSLTTHCLAALLGAGLTVSLNGLAAEPSAEAMLEDLSRHVAQIDQQLAQLQQRDSGSSAKQSSGTFTTPFTVTNGTRTVLKITSDDKADTLILGDGKPGAITLTRSVKDGAVITANNAAGNSVVRLSGLKAGGQLAVYAPDGKEPAVKIETYEAGGTVRVFPNSGHELLAELSAWSGYGAVTTYAKDGTPTALMMSDPKDGTGYFMLANAKGNEAVEAKVVGKGIGVVRVGPGGNGPAAVVGGSALPASMIQGNGK